MKNPDILLVVGYWTKYELSGQSSSVFSRFNAEKA